MNTPVRVRPRPVPVSSLPPLDELPTGMTNGVRHDADGVVLDDDDGFAVSGQEVVQPVALGSLVPMNDPDSDTFKLLKEVKKMYGDKVVTTAAKLPTFKHTPFGIFPLDFAMGGGLPEGLCTMIFGWPSGGKTTTALRAIANAQAKYPNKQAVFVDAEGTLDVEWAAIHGVDVDNLLIVHPSSGEQAADLTCAFMASREISIVCLDSLPALIPMKEIEKSMEDATVGGSSQLIGRFLRKATHTMNEARKIGHWPTLILINQWRYKIGVTHGDPRTLPGGQAINYVAAVKLEVMNKEKAGHGDNETKLVAVNEHSFKIHKNKVMNGPRDGEFQMIRSPDHPLGMGFIDDGKAAVQLAKKLGMVQGGGQSWRCNGIDRTFRILDDLVKYLYEVPQDYEALKHAIITQQRTNMMKNPDWY